MLWKLIFLIFFIIDVRYCEHDQSSRCTTPASGSSIYDSFLKLKKKIKCYFHIKISFDNLEKRRRKIKTAFHNFIDEAFSEEKKSNLSAISFAGDVLEAGMSAPQMAALHGYRVESHTVATLDGYMLTIHRIRSGFQEQIEMGDKLVLLHHGLLGSSDDWILLGTGKALPYLLLDAGYDVWLANARGNKYSTTHISKFVDTPDFWDFSWHEIGVYDLSAVIEYIMDITGGKLKINFIGHSMGATALLVLLSSSPKFNIYLRSAVLLAPLAFMYHVKGPLKTFANYYRKNTSVDFLGGYEFVPTLEVIREVAGNFCLGEIKICLNPLLLLANGGQKSRDPRLVDTILSHVPAGASTKTLVHYLQLINSGQFQNYDYGSKLNLKKYSAALTPVYNLQNVLVPIILFSSIDDWLSTIPDVISMMTKLPNLFVHHLVKVNHFRHTDFVWSEDAPELVYYLVIEVLEQVLQTESSV